MSDAFLEVAVDAATRAGELLRSRFGSLRHVAYKGGPTNLVTEMDGDALGEHEFELFVLALSFSGINGYWYVSSYGVPWFDKPISLHGGASGLLAGVCWPMSRQMRSSAGASLDRSTCGAKASSRTASDRPQRRAATQV